MACVGVEGLDADERTDLLSDELENGRVSYG